MDFCTSAQASQSIDLNTIEERLTAIFSGLRPNHSFKSGLKQRLQNSRIYRRRRELGARLVLAFSFLMLAFLAVALEMFIQRRS